MTAETVYEKLKAAGLLSRLAQGMGGYEHAIAILEDALGKARQDGINDGYDAGWGQARGDTPL